MNGKQSKSNLWAGLADFIRRMDVENRVDRFLGSRRLFSMKHNAVIYLRRLTSIAVEAALLVAATWLLCTVLLYAAFALWKLYGQTPMGQQYFELFPQRAETINEIFEYEASYLAGDVTLSAFVICMGLSAIGQFLHINRCFYFSRGLLGKLLFWGLGLTAAVTYYLYREYEFSSWEVVAIVAAVPTYCLFSNCYGYTERLLPELGDLVRLLISNLKKLKRNILSAEK